MARGQSHWYPEVIHPQDPQLKKGCVVISLLLQPTGFDRNHSTSIYNTHPWSLSLFAVPGRLPHTVSSEKAIKKKRCGGGGREWLQWEVIRSCFYFPASRRANKLNGHKMVVSRKTAVKQCYMESVLSLLPFWSHWNPEMDSIATSAVDQRILFIIINFIIIVFLIITNELPNSDRISRRGRQCDPRSAQGSGEAREEVAVKIHGWRIPAKWQGSACSRKGAPR